MQIVTHEQIDTRTGINQLLNNISAWLKISEIMSTTLGPYGRDKLFVQNDNLLITNDGATILKKLSINHPAGNFLLKISESQDKNVGDGTTSVVLLAVDILTQLKSLIKDKFCLKNMIRTLKEIEIFVIKELENMKFNIDDEILVKLGMTSLSSKILSSEREFFSRMVIDGVKQIENLDDLGIKKIRGGGFEESFLVNGVAFEKTFTYAGYGQQPKLIKNAKILCLNVELEWKSERENAEVRVNVDNYQSMVDAEWKIIRDKLDIIIKSGANVVLSSQPIGDYATQYFARFGIFCAGRVMKEDLVRITKSCGGVIYSSVNNIQSLGFTTTFEEKQIGNFRYNFFESKKANTLILRGPGNEIINEVERSLNDTANVIFYSLKSPFAISGAGCAEMEISKKLREKSKSITDQRAFIYMAVGKAFEIIPFNLAKNFGLDPLIAIQKLRKDHHNNKMTGVTFSGINEISDVFEPIAVKKTMYHTALNAVYTLLNVDGTFVAAKPNQ